MMPSGVACHRQPLPRPARVVQRVPGGTPDTSDAARAHRVVPGTPRRGEDAGPAPVVGCSALGGPDEGGVAVEARVRRALRRHRVTVRVVSRGTSTGAVDGPCTCTLRMHTAGVLLDGDKSTKASTSRLSWSPSGPQQPGDAPAASRVTASRPLRPPLLTASHYPSVLTPTLAAATAAHGMRNISRSVQTRLVNTAAIADVEHRHVLVEPVPVVGTGWGKG